MSFIDIIAAKNAQTITFPDYINDITFLTDFPDIFVISFSWYSPILIVLVSRSTLRPINSIHRSRPWFHPIHKPGYTHNVCKQNHYIFSDHSLAAQSWDKRTYNTS